MDRPIRNILTYRIGSLGDTLVAVPAMWAVRNQFPDARITLLCDRQADKRYVLGADLLANTCLMNDLITYDVVEGQGRTAQWMEMAKLLVRLRVRRFDALVYLAPTMRTAPQVRRDLAFFRMAGIRRVFGAEGFAYEEDANGAASGEIEMREAERFLGRLARSGLRVPPPEDVRTDIDLGPTDIAIAERWRQEQGPDGDRPWLALGPGSKMPVKIWPPERYEQVVQRLIDRYDIWPVIFGGPEDRAVGRRLIDAWGRGFNAAGALGLRSSAAAIGRCVMYLGNDTGTMHLAASAGVRCAAVFCSHNVPGRWYPVGTGHRIFRTNIDCENCGLFVCVDRAMECILRVDVEQVYQGCCEILDEIGVPQATPSVA